MAWNTHKIQEIVDEPDRHRPTIRMDKIAEVGPVASSNINFRGVLHFPLEEFSEPTLRAPAAVPAAR